MFRQVIIALSALFGTMIGGLSLMSPVSALEAGDIVMQVVPAEQKLDLTVGEYTGHIEVSNIGRLPFTFTLSTRPYQVTNDSYDPDFSTQNNYTRLSNWIHFEKTEFRLEAGESIGVDFTVDVPAGVPGGGQYAAIIIETRDSQDPNTTAQTINQLASLVYARIEGEEHVGGVLVAQDLPSFLLGSPFSSITTVKNDGNIDFRVEHSLTIRNFFTNREVFVPNPSAAPGHDPASANMAVLPGTSRTNILTWSGAPQLGVFRAVSTVTFLDQEYTREQIVFLCPIWLAGIIIFLIVLMFLWLILRARKRRRSRPQIV